MERKSNLRSVIVASAILMMTIAAASTIANDRGKGHGRLLEQLTQFDGGCPPNECSDVRFSIHRAPVCPNGPDADLGLYSISMNRIIPTLALGGGASTLVRTDEGIAFSMQTSDLAPDAPYTVWWVAFNPDNPCISDTDPCSCAEAALRPGADSVFFATGGMSDQLGSAQFAAHIDYGEIPDGFDQTPFGGLFAVGIEPGAEIHLVVRSHGPALQGGGRVSDD